MQSLLWSFELPAAWPVLADFDWPVYNRVWPATYAALSAALTRTLAGNNSSLQASDSKQTQQQYQRPQPGTQKNQSAERRRAASQASEPRSCVDPVNTLVPSGN